MTCFCFPVAWIINRWLRGWLFSIIPSGGTWTRWRVTEFRSPVCSQNTRQQSGGSQHMQRSDLKAWLCSSEVSHVQFAPVFLLHSLMLRPKLYSFSCPFDLNLEIKKVTLKHTLTFKKNKTYDSLIFQNIMSRYCCSDFYLLSLGVVHHMQIKQTLINKHWPWASWYFTYTVI